MATTIGTASSIRFSRRHRHPLLSLLGGALLLLAGCAPRATVHGADPVAAALRTAAGTVDSAPDGRVVSRYAGTGATGPQLMRTASRAASTTSAVSLRTTPAWTTVTATPAPAGALVGDAWVGHYTGTGSTPRTALGLTLRAGAAHPPAHAADAPLTGELLLWAAPAASVFDAAGAAHASGRVVRVPLARARYTGGQLRLTTEPFLDPACGCTVHGVFTGALRGDTLAGRFSLLGASTVASRGGRWALVRDTRP